MVLNWPKTRSVRDSSGAVWVAVIEPGRLSLTPPPGTDPALLVDDPDRLRALALTLYAAAIEYDQALAIPPGTGRAHLKRQRARRAARPPRQGRLL